jgi:Ca2+-binding EF-hand superfamily protein
VMVRIAAVLVMLVFGLAQVALAEESALDKAMRKNPDRFSERAIDLIAGFGGPDGLRAAGIEEHIALERAGARASALRRFLAMDLDGDGVVGRAELAVCQRAANASTRGRMERQFAAADSNADGQVDAAELKTAGQVAGQQGLDEAEAGVLRALMTLDADGDGALLGKELLAAVARVSDAS